MMIIPNNKNNFIEALLKVFISTSSCFWASFLVVLTVLFIFKIPITNFNIILTFFPTLVFCVWYARKVSPDIHVLSSIFSLFLFSAILVPSILISSKIYDLSYDGQAYHQEAIIQFSRGWNPVYMMLNHEATGNLERWLNHYPKGAWIPEAGLHAVTGNIESGKAFGIFSIFLAFVSVVWGLWDIKRLPFWGKIIAALILSLNPVSVYQSLSFYVDGLLSSWLLIYICVLIKIFQGAKKEIFWLYLFVFIVLVNLKLTALVFTLLFSGAFILLLWVNNKLKSALWVFKITLAAFAAGVLFVGYNPYVTNLALKGHPLYPAMGRGALDYVPLNTPENYWKLPSPVRLVASMFSTSSNARGRGEYAYLKLPFTIGTGELLTFRETNTKIGGFGPLFGGAALLSFLVLALCFDFGDYSKSQKLIFFGCLAFVVGSASQVATSSVARFVPFVWWAPCAVVIIALGSRSFIGKMGGLIVLVVLLINVSVIADSYFPYNISQSKRLETQLAELSKNKDSTFMVDVGLFGSTKIKLESYRIPYYEVYENTPCTKRTRFLTHNVAQICVL